MELMVAHPSQKLCYDALVVRLNERREKDGAQISMFVAISS